MVHAFKSSTQEAVAGGSLEFETRVPGLHIEFQGSQDHIERPKEGPNKEITRTTKRDLVSNK